MRITLIYDNSTSNSSNNSSDRSFENSTVPCAARANPGWGFSCLVEGHGKTLLFDTGWDGNLLLSNMKALEISPSKIDAVVLSHPHWDHIGGLPDLLHASGEKDVYLPASFSLHLKAEIARLSILHEVRNPGEILDGFLTTGDLAGVVSELSLIIMTPGGGMLVTGCAHPGLARIIEVARELTPLHGVIGGFHEFSDYDSLRGMKMMVPCHCTRNPKEIERRFPVEYRSGGAGLSLDFPDNPASGVN